MLVHVFRGDMDQSEYDVLLPFCCNRTYPPLYNKNERDCLRRRAKSLVGMEGVLFYRDKAGGEIQVKYLELTDDAIGCDREGQTKRS